MLHDFCIFLHPDVGNSELWMQMHTPPSGLLSLLFTLEAVQQAGNSLQTESLNHSINMYAVGTTCKHRNNNSVSLSGLHFSEGRQN